VYVLLFPPTPLSVEGSKEADESGTGVNGECIWSHSTVSFRLTSKATANPPLFYQQNFSAYDKNTSFQGEGCIPGLSLLSITMSLLTTNYSAVNIEHFLERTAAFVVIGMLLFSHFKHSLTFFSAR